MVCYAAKLTDTVEKQQTEHSPWYHITPFRVILCSGWIMAFQRTECSLGPLTESGEVNLKSIRRTSVRRELVVDHIMIPHLGASPAFTWGKFLMQATPNYIELLCLTWTHVDSL